MRNTHTLVIALATLTLAACGDKQQDRAVAILSEAEQKYSAGDYESAISLIDSLRRSCPKALDARKKALVLFQDASEKLAQRQITETDKALQSVNEEIAAMQQAVDEHRNNATATAEELSRMTLLKTRRDSLQTRFDTQCATVRLIREKRKADKE